MNDQKKIKIIEIISKNIKVSSKLINESSCMTDFAKWDSLSHVNLIL